MDYRIKAEENFEYVQKIRRQLHTWAEVGFDLPKTVALVDEELTKMGIEHYPVGKAGICAIIGKGEKCVLLRADMDALPMKETTGLPYASTGDGTHSCGHDCHAAMLLGAAKLLKENEANLKGTVKLMFQPAEELLAGAVDMIENGILENPKPDVAFATHVSVGQPGTTVGRVTYSSGPALYSGDAVKIEVTGKAAHGSASFMGVDAINIAAHIVVALNEIISREIPLDEHSVVLVGKISGGDTVNTTAGSATLEVSVRAQTQEKRDFLKKRIKEISEGIAATFRGRADVQFVYGMAPLYCDPQTARDAHRYVESLGYTPVCVPTAGGTEDFTAVANIIPSVMLNLGAGSLEEGHLCSMHNAGMIVNEDVLPTGVAIYCQCATQWLEENA
ncbi:MAG: amidohydrolase [Oscillospiraceae bacterium]|nr:amidohydrolase [Oscillospiraceae bacterium]